jgi:hypothetical protein
MALVIGLKQGGQFKIMGHTFTVNLIHDSRNFEVTMAGESTGEYTLDANQESIEVLPDVMIAAGFGDTNEAKVLITAPREIRIEKLKNRVQTPRVVKTPGITWTISGQAKQQWSELSHGRPLANLLALVEQAEKEAGEVYVYGEFKFKTNKHHRVMGVWRKD